MKKLFFLFAFISANMLLFAEPIASEYCGEPMSSGNTLAAFTWETNDQGAIVITISEILGGDLSATHFRGNGINIDKIKVGELREDAANYFTLACGGAPTITLTPKTGVTLDYGTKIYVTNQIIEYATSKDGNAWPTLTFEYTYGGQCLITPELTTISLTAPSSFAKIGEGVTLTVTTLDQMNRPIDAQVDLSVAPADAGTLTGNVYTPLKAVPATITATSGTISHSIVVYGVPSGNLALNKPCAAGYEPGNQDEISPKANDGNVNTQWVTYADQPAAVEWWYVDLEAKYQIAAVDVLWGDPTSTSYIVQVRDNAPTETEAADDNAWTTIATLNDITINSEQFIPCGEATLGRYVRIHSLAKSANFFRMKEVRVFGTEWTGGDDTEAPVMVSATVAEAYSSSLVLAVAATDNNQLITKYHVVEATAGLDNKYIPMDGKITIDGLTPGTSYNFVVTAIDGNNNESTNSITVPVQTPARALVPNTPAPVPTWPANQVKSLYSDSYPFAPASLNSYNEGWWNNPKMTIEDVEGNHYLHYDLYRAGMIGSMFGEISVALMEKIHIDVWASKAGTITFRPIIDGDPDELNNIRKTLVLEAEKWNSFDINMSEFGEHNWMRLFQFSIENYEAGGLVGEHISVDNLYFYRTTHIVDDEAPTNVQASMISAGFFNAVLAVSAEDNSGVVAYEVKDGETVLASGGGASGATVNINVQGLLPNTAYNLSVIAKDDNGNEADQVIVPVQTASSPAPAPTPDFTNKETVNVFCDLLDNAPGINIGGWGQTTQASLAQLAEGDNVWFCTNFNYLGWEFQHPVNASGMEKLHFDFYTLSMNSIQITPISTGPKEGVYPIILTPNTWVSVDVPLSAYAAVGINWSDIFQMKFMEANPAGSELFIDNVYFYKEVGEGLEQITDRVESHKMLLNGVLYIERNGVRYTTAGQVVK